MRKLRTWYARLEDKRPSIDPDGTTHEAVEVCLAIEAIEEMARLERQILELHDKLMQIRVEVCGIDVH